MNLSKVFDQYLRTTKIPVFEYRVDAATLSYRWANVVPGFDMPLRVALGGGAYTRIKPTDDVADSCGLPAAGADVRVDENFYVDVKNAAAPVKP